MTYRERRHRIHMLMAEAGELIQEAGDRRHELWLVATDDLADAIASGGTVGLREAFTDAARDFWLRENELHSVKAPAFELIRGGAA